MSNEPAPSGQVIDVGPLGNAFEQARTRKIFASKHVDLIRMVLPAGKQIAEHTAKGEITVHCLEGLVDFTVAGQTVSLSPGRLLCLSNREPHSLQALENSSLLLTLLRTPEQQAD